MTTEWLYMKSFILESFSQRPNRSPDLKALVLGQLRQYYQLLSPTLEKLKMFTQIIVLLFYSYVVVVFVCVFYV